ncbi:hypothetical protein V2J09_013698 [Rumex salicifolius]
MAPPVLHLPSPFPLQFLRSTTKPRLSLFTASAADTDSPPEPESESGSAPSTNDSDPFESRLSNVRIRYRSGTGKKAEIRKTRKSKGNSTGSGSGSGVFLPPVPLKKARSGGLKVEFGFTPYSEVVNGRIAGLGLVALLAVELATGKGVINYHSPSIVFLQVYFMAAASALYLKFEKEKVSIWPPPTKK